MRIFMWMDILKKNREHILQGTFVLLQAADMFAIHLFVNKRFLNYGKVILAVMNLSGIQYNTPEYYRALNRVALVLSFLVGGLLVLAVNKILEKLAMELEIIDRNIYAVVIPAIFWVVHLLGVLGLWIFNKDVYGWLCPLLAYTAGIGYWAIAIKKNKSGNSGET